MSETDINFRQTEIGKIPKEWVVIKLGDRKICKEIYYGITAKATRKNTGIRMLRTTDIKNYSVDWGQLPYCEITGKSNNIIHYLLKKNDIIIARAGTVGVSTLVDTDFDNVIFGSYLIKVKLNSEVYHKFIHYFLQSTLYWNHIRKAQGSTLKNINLPLLKSLLLPLPRLSEQEKIAEVLSTMDEAIQKVDEAIEKAERLKKGLMQELLTKGIGHKEFKDTKIGRIPKEWKVVRLIDFIKYQKGRKPNVVINQKETGSLPYLNAESLRVGIFNQWTKRNESIIRINRDDLILIWDGFHCGDSFVGFEGVLSSTMIKIEPKKSNLNKLFLFYFLKSRAKILNTQIAGMYLKHVSKSVFESLIIPLPTFLEQQKIVEVLFDVDKKLGLERKRKEKLQRIKKGLMNDLLSGRKRVKID